jgi:hypothetical protein
VPLVRAVLFCALLAAAGPFDAASVRAEEPGESPESANAFLDRFIGRWIGEGTVDGLTVRDELVCERVLGGTFLFMQDRELGGGSFQADTYIGYRVEQTRYELYSFNNNTALGSSLPVRLMTGSRVGDSLVVQEAPGGGQSLRYTFEFLDEDTFRLTKAFIEKRRARPFVIQLFRRQPPE